MNADPPRPIVLYDMSAFPQGTSYASNAWKIRYALNFKGLHYRTEWVDRLDIELVRKQLKAPPNQTFWDGSPYYTLPVIQDLATGEVIGDSFDIALYLEKTYSDTPSLFPFSTVGLQEAFNKQADATFSRFYILFIYNIPLTPETAEKIKASIVWRMQKEKWEDLNIQGKERARVLDDFKAALGELARFYDGAEGPFLGGETPLYADFVIGGWLVTLKAALKEWKEVQLWHNALWGKIHLALGKYTEVK